MNSPTLAQLLELRRAEYRKSLQQSAILTDPYVQSVKVDFVAVLDRHFYMMRGAA